MQIVSCKWPLPGREYGKVKTKVCKRGKITGDSSNEKQRTNQEIKSREVERVKQGLQSEGACCVLSDVLAYARPAKDLPFTHLALPSISHWPMTHGIFHSYL